VDGTVTEMVSVDGLVRNNPNTWELLHDVPGETRCAVQLFGAKPETFSEALGVLAAHDRVPDAIDVNMGCPVRKVVGAGAGAALMRDPVRAGRVVESVVEAMERRRVRRPVWVKIRSGWDDDSINAPALARVLQDAGASGITVHARTRRAHYSGRADWRVIADVVDAVKIPVLGNGDVRSGEDAVAMLSETGCLGVMVGRAALGAPWIFDPMIAILDGRTPRGNPRPEERIRVVLCHLEMEVALRGSERAARFMRKHIHWYTHGLPGSARLRERVNHCNDAETLHRVLAGYRAKVGNLS